MDENIKQLCEKACIEYCENGYVSEELYKDFIQGHGKLCYPDKEQANSFMRDFIHQYIWDHSLPWKNNTYLFGEAYGFGIITCIDAIPKEGHIGLIQSEPVDIGTMECTPIKYF